MTPIHRMQILAGLFTPIIFWATLAFCGSLMGQYNHLSNLVSELGAAGTDTRGVFALGLLICSALSLVFAVGLFRECRRKNISLLPVVVLFTYTFSIAGAAVFPMPHPLHGILGSPSALLILSPLLAMALWRKKPALKGLFPASILSFLFFALAFLVFNPAVLNEYLGLKQRFFHLGWSIWFIYLSIVFQQRKGYPQ